MCLLCLLLVILIFFTKRNIYLCHFSVNVFILYDKFYTENLQNAGGNCSLVAINSSFNLS